MVGVSPDPIEKLQEFRGSSLIPFTLLSDEDRAVARLYGAWGEKTSQGKTTLGVLRSHFVIDEQGIVRDVQIKVSPEDSVRLAVAKLEELAAAPA